MSRANDAAAFCRTHHPRAPTVTPTLTVRTATPTLTLSPCPKRERAGELATTLVADAEVDVRIAICLQAATLSATLGIGFVSERKPDPTQP